MSGIAIRPMEPRDLAQAAELAGELGFPSSRSDMERRFARISPERMQAVFVAEGGDGRMAGWMYVHAQYSMESDAYAEIGGLVVSNRFRRQGVGRALVAHAEQWARERSFRRVVVRSNVLRQEAHRFYPAAGYALHKTQNVYERFLSE